MKRGHRTTHRLLWTLMLPVLAYILWLAIDSRAPAPTEERLPDISKEERFQ